MRHLKKHPELSPIIIKLNQMARQIFISAGPKDKSKYTRGREGYMKLII